MHVTHLADQIIATRFVLGPAIPPKGSAGTSFVRLACLAADMSNGVIQQSPRVLVLQHGPDIPPGHLGTALTEAGREMVVVALDAGEQIPDGDWAGVASLGGVMGAHDEEAHPWLADEKRFLAGAVEAGTPTLGICLGAQLLADALGGRAYRSDGDPEIGIVTATLTEEGRADPVTAGLTGAVPTRHFDTFDLPPGAVLLAASDRFPHVFRWGSAVAIQSHLEADPSIVAGWMENLAAAEQLEEAGVDPAVFMEEIRSAATETAEMAARVFGAWVGSL